MDKRKYALLQSNVFYRKKFRWVNFCIYCGQKAQCLDHVFPLCFASMFDLQRPNVRKQFFQGLNLVPSCNECNALAGKNLFYSIKEKRKFIKTKLRKKYKRHSKNVVWDDDEIKELGFNLRKFIETKQHNKKYVDYRLCFPIFARKRKDAQP